MLDMNHGTTKFTKKNEAKVSLVGIVVMII